MGRVRTKTVKRAARQLIEKFYPKMSLDFHYNKRVLDDVAIVPSKRIRNKIAGYASKLMRRIQKGPVRGISLKLQEEERERKMESVPEHDEFSSDRIQIDNETLDMLDNLGFSSISNDLKKRNINKIYYIN